MAVNHYFQGGRGIGNDAEKRLHEDIIIESLKIFGQDIYYLPRTLVNRDLILENANFYLNTKNYNFFIKLLDENFKNGNLIIKNSNVFFRNSMDEVLFITNIFNC